MIKNNEVYSESVLKHKLQTQADEILGYIYSKYRKEFMAFAMKFNINKNSALDLYQDSVIALYQNFAIKQVVINENVTVKTYLFGIGKNKIYTELKRSKTVFNSANFNDVETITLDEDEGLSGYQTQLKNGFLQLGGKCKTVLNMFYYRGFTIKEIVEHSHYKDENTVKSLKSRCLKKLKELTR